MLKHLFNLLLRRGQICVKDVSLCLFEVTTTFKEVIEKIMHTYGYLNALTHMWKEQICSAPVYSDPMSKIKKKHTELFCHFKTPTIPGSTVPTVFLSKTMF